MRLVPDDAFTADVRRGCRDADGVVAVHGDPLGCGCILAKKSLLANASEGSNAESVGGHHGIQEAGGREGEDRLPGGSANGVPSAGLIGVSNSEACRRLGVNRWTGTRSRVSRTMVLASCAGLEVARVATSGSSKRAYASYLPVDVRVLIGDGLCAGATMTRIAADLGRAMSRITGEVHRNSEETGAYRPVGGALQGPDTTAPA